MTIKKESTYTTQGMAESGWNYYNSLRSLGERDKGMIYLGEEINPVSIRFSINTAKGKVLAKLFPDFKEANFIFEGDDSAIELARQKLETDLSMKLRKETSWYSNQ